MKVPNVRRIIRLLRGCQMSDEGSANAGPPAPIDDTTVVSRNQLILTAEVGAETAMMNLEQDRFFGLDDIGGDIWRRLQAPRTFGDLINDLMKDYDANRATIADDVRTILTEMAAHNLVKFS
jgi:hypothetical protein